MTGYRLKIVERGGTKLVDMLHKANPWAGQDCGVAAFSVRQRSMKGREIARIVEREIVSTKPTVLHAWRGKTKI